MHTRVGNVYYKNLIENQINLRCVAFMTLGNSQKDIFELPLFFGAIYLFVLACHPFIYRPELRPECACL